ncbi:MAG: Ribosome LSU-associated GTP-binding protein HflX, partial [uncultured Phycisphaerae bacterium]
QAVRHARHQDARLAAGARHRGAAERHGRVRPRPAAQPRRQLQGDARGGRPRRPAAARRRRRPPAGRATVPDRPQGARRDRRQGDAGTAAAEQDRHRGGRGELPHLAPAAPRGDRDQRQDGARARPAPGGRLPGRPRAAGGRHARGGRDERAADLVHRESQPRPRPRVQRRPGPAQGRDGQAHAGGPVAERSGGGESGGRAGV